MNAYHLKGKNTTGKAFDFVGKYSKCYMIRHNLQVIDYQILINIYLITIQPDYLFF
jgi:hypothetical protein